MSCRIHKPSSCNGCPLATPAYYSPRAWAEYGRAFSEPEGTGANGVLIVGEALDEHGARDGYPLRHYSESGSLLNRAFGMAGLRREQFAIFNIVACRPPNSELTGAGYEQAAIEHCRVHLLKVVEQFRPKCILALGAVAVRSLTGLTGDRLTLSYIRGFALASNIQRDCSDNRVHSTGDNHRNDGDRNDRSLSIPVIGTYHPSFIKRGSWALLPVLVKDIRLAVDVAKYGPPETFDLKYTTHGTPGDLEAMRDDLRANPDLPLSTDIETNYAELVDETGDAVQVATSRQDLTQINLSTAEKTALVVTATPPNVSLVREIHALPNMKVGHNLFMFDKVQCEWNDVPLAGPLLDTMWMFHHVYPDLPGKQGKMSGTGDDSADEGSVANLQFVASFYNFPIPWKHLSGSNPEWYGGCDADSALRAFWGIYRDMEQLGILESYYSLVHELLPILENMMRRGVPVNVGMILALHDDLARDIRGIEGETQLHVPRELLPLHPKTGFKKTPKDTAGHVQIEVDLSGEVKTCCMRERKPAKSGEIARKYVDSPHAHLRGVKFFAPNPECEKCGGTGTLILQDRTELRWAKELPFNVGSSDQMWGYVHWKGYKVVKNSKRKFAMDAETVEKLAKQHGDPLFNLCVTKRRLEKLDSTYCGQGEPGRGWMPGSDGRVHPQVGPYPATGQLSGRKPNPQNVPNISKISEPKQLENATRFRNALWAEPGYTILEFDFKSFHVQTLGLESGDPDYIRLGKIDIHSFFAAVGILKLERVEQLLPLPDAELKAKLKWYRKNYKLKNGDSFDLLRNKQAKVAVLAYGLGQGPSSLYLGNQESFTGPAEAAQVSTAMDRTFPKEKLYRDTQPLTVKPNGYKIKNRFGFIRWFFDVQRLDRRSGTWKHGDDWEAAIAFNVQATAHGHLRECMKRCEYAGYNERFGFDNTVHDSLRFHCLTTLVEECVQLVKPVLEHESEIMLMPWAGNKGLSVEVEVKAGSNWGVDMHELTI